MPYPNFHAARLVSPFDVDESTYGYKQNEFGKGIDVIYAQDKQTKKTVIQAIRFNKDIFSLSQVREWLKEHDYTSYIKLEEASELSEEVNNIDLTNTVNLIYGTHNATLHRLESWVNFHNSELVPGGQVFYSLDNFKGTENQWDGIPVIFIPEGKIAKHPNHNLVIDNLDAAAESVGGYVVGRVSGTTVYSGENNTGEPRISANFEFTCPEVEKYARSGKLSISTGFNALVTREGYMNGKVIPNHALLFVRNSCKTCRSNDNSAFFNNLSQEDNNVTEIEINNAVPPHTDTYGKDYTGRWRAPNLFNFTSKPRLSDLPEKQIRDIAAHFAYAREMPPKNFSDLKLGHHDPKKTGLGEVNRRGVLSAMAVLAGAMGGIDIPKEDKRLAYEHLKQHRIELGDKEEDIPEFNNLISGEFDMTDEINEVSLDQESKGLFKTLIEKIEAGFAKTEVQNTIENSDAGEPKSEEVDMTEMDNIKTELSEKITEIDNLKAEVTEKDTKITELDNTVKELQAKIDANEAEKVQAAKDQVWAEVKNSVPAGWLEDEAKTREEFESDPVSFASKLIGHNNSIKTTEAEGVTAVGNNTVEPKKLGKYNSNTGKYDEVD